MVWLSYKKIVPYDTYSFVHVMDYIFLAHQSCFLSYRAVCSGA